MLGLGVLASPRFQYHTPRKHYQTGLVFRSNLNITVCRQQFLQLPSPWEWLQHSGFALSHSWIKEQQTLVQALACFQRLGNEITELEHPELAGPEDLRSPLSEQGSTACRQL